MEQQNQQQQKPAIQLPDNILIFSKYFMLEYVMADRKQGLEESWNVYRLSDFLNPATVEVAPVYNVDSLINANRLMERLDNLYDETVTREQAQAQTLAKIKSGLDVVIGQ